MWKGKVVCLGFPIFDAECTLLPTDRSLSAQQLSSILPFALHVTGRLDKLSGREYLQQLLSDPTRSITFLLLTQSPSSPQNDSNSESTLHTQGELGMILRTLEEAGKYGVGVGNPQNIKDIYFLTVEEAEAVSMLSIEPLVQADALVVVVVPQRHISNNSMFK